MKLTTLAAAASVAALTFGFAAAANAADATATPFTAELGLAAAHNSTDDVDTNLIGLQGRFGYQFHKNFGVEAEAAVGLGDGDNVQVGPSTYINVKEQYEFGAFAVGYLPLGDRTDLIGRVGYATNRLKAGSAHQDNDGAAAGVGVRVFPEDSSLGLRVDYTHYFFDHDAASDAVSATVAYRF